MNSKKWLKIFMLLAFLSIGITGTLNYIIDPLWNFSHSNKFNNMQSDFDERKQKTLYLRNHSGFDSLLMGSSRATYYNQNEFNNMNVFNYSFSAAEPYEYSDYIKYFKSKNKIENLIISMDFFNSIAQEKQIPENKIKLNKNLIRTISESSKLSYFFKNYISIDTLSYSLENIKRFLLHKTFHRSYDRNNIASVDKVKEEQVIKIAKKRSQNLYSKMPIYNSDLIKTFNKIKSENKNINIIIYTTPLSKLLLDSIFKDKQLKKYYYMWLSDLVNSFGEIYFTTYYNELSNNYYKHSKDGDHFYPYVGKEITNYITKGNLSKNKIDISKNILEINKKNLKQTIANINLLIK